MKTNIKIHNLVYISLFVLLLCTPIIKAQINKELTPGDKIKIINTILKTYDFKISQNSKTKKKNVILHLPEGFTSQRLSEIKGIEFIIINEQEVEEIKKTGGSFFEFGLFVVDGSVIKINFNFYRIFAFYDKMEGSSGSYIQVYDCRKVENKWKVKGKKGGGTWTHYKL